MIAVDIARQQTGAGMGVLAAIGLFVLGNAVQLAVETTSEVTAETYSDNDVGISVGPVQIASDDIVNLSPTAMIVVR